MILQTNVTLNVTLGLRSVDPNVTLASGETSSTSPSGSGGLTATSPSEVSALSASNRVRLSKSTFRVVTDRLNQRSWKPDDHTLRPDVEIMAKHIGVSLSFATVNAHKVLRPEA